MKIIFSIFFIIFSLNSYATNLFNQLVLENEKTEIKIEKDEFFSNHVFVLFYSSTCSYCHAFTPVIKSWAQNHKAEILPLTFDGKTLPDFPRFETATKDWINIAFKGREISYPALFILNHNLKKIYHVSNGALNKQELTHRLEEIIPKIEKYEQGIKS